MQAPSTSKVNIPRGRLIGLEFENQLVYTKNGFSIKKKDIKSLWQALVVRGWEPTYDTYTKALIGVTKGGVVLNTDTAVCNIEFALPPKTDLLAAKKEYQKVFAEVMREAKKLGFTALSLGIIPRKLPHDLYSIKTEKGIYRLIRDRYVRHNIQIPISAHQVCIDVPVRTVIEVANHISQIGGFLVALTANSAIENDTVRPWKELRMLYWKVPFGNKVRNMTHIFGGFLKKEYTDLADYFLDVWSATPLVLIKKGEWMHLKNWKISTLQYLESKKPVPATTIDGQERSILPGREDLNLAMVLAWNDVRIHILVDEAKVSLQDFLTALHAHTLEKYLDHKVFACYIESRICSPSPKGEEVAVPALLLGLVENIQGLSRFCASFSWSEGRELKAISSVRGMDHVFKGVPMAEHLKTLLEIAEKGLKGRGKEEEQFLRPLWRRVNTRKSPADVTIETFRSGGIMEVIRKNSY